MDIINRLRILPRWIIIAIDLSIISASTFIGFMLRFNFTMSEARSFNFFYGLAVCVGCGLVSTLITKSYAGIVRYTGIEDGIRILYTSFLSLVLSALINLVFYYNFEKNVIPYSVLLIVFLASFVFLFYYRLLVKSFFGFYRNELGAKTNVAVFGAGQAGIMTKQAIDQDHQSTLKVAAFFEDDQAKIGKEITGTKIYDATTDFEKIIRQFNIHELIISIENLSFERKNEMVDACLKYGIKIRAIPPVRQWVRGELSLKQIKDIRIEDLLGRPTIQLENNLIKEFFFGKCLIVTGAAGSIGSEISRQLLSYHPSHLVLIDQAESALYDIERELRKRETDVEISVYVADICNKERMANIFRELKPRALFHAAAYKHVPLMESNPVEAVICNVMGTKILADLSIEHGLEKFVMISTDKAVNPTSIMGCSKRIAEIYVQSLNNHKELLEVPHTAFVTTRFGNVLGSNGSVVPIFKKQIENGGPLTVTHPEITRYFMTIPEACSLVLEAGIMGRGGEIFIFDMGSPVKIYDLAKKMILLSGLEIGKDIEIVFTGLREGEKLFEELLSKKEDTIPTHHSKILKAKVAQHALGDINNYIDLFDELINDRNELKLVALMKEIVPEYKSNISRFEVLD
ncbi:MAG: polysaccharide biosynthesis protein [Cyclobacteriaceae bacterium]|nr:polysaccharide biosynthesis protein [Cyclobacteriaceae bacterium]